MPFKNNRKIIIKPADKGSNIVIMNRTDYVQEGLRQLNDGKFYRKMDGDLTDVHLKKVKDVVDEMVENKEITKKTGEYLLQDSN